MLRWRVMGWPWLFAGALCRVPVNCETIAPSFKQGATRAYRQCPDGEQEPIMIIKTRRR